MGLRRKHANKGRSARSFNNGQRKSHVFNLKIQRGGWRL